MSPLLRVELEEDPEEEQKEEDATLPIDVVSLEVLLNTPALRSNNDGTERAVDGGIKCEERERERESSFVKERGFFSEEKKNEMSLLYNLSTLFPSLERPHQKRDKKRARRKQGW